MGRLLGRNQAIGQPPFQGGLTKEQGKELNGVKNVEMAVDGTILTVKVDLAKEFGPSSSGKTIIVASTEGNAPVPGADDIKVGLNVYKKPGR